MKTQQLQERVIRVAGRLSIVARDVSRRILTNQQAVLTEKAEREVRENRLFKDRLSRARSGLRRFLAFADSQSVRRIAKANERLGNQDLLFYKDDWNVIGLSATSHISFFIGPQGVNITMTNSCHVTDMATATFPHKGQEIEVREVFGFQPRSVLMSSQEDILCRMANGTVTSAYKTSEESTEAFRILALWSRSVPFEKVVIEFLKRLEKRWC